jgi:glycosyltransferase involved in cell wall biosynthesis
MKKLRILHVTFDMAIGGTEQVIRQLVLNLPAAEFDNEIFCIDGKIGAVGEKLQQQGIHIHRAPRKAGLDFELIKTLRQTLRSGNFDVVHCHQYTPWVYGWFAAWGCKAKVVFTEHGRFFPDRSRGKALPLNVLMSLTTAAITAISSATRDALARYEWVAKPLVQVVYNGIQPLAADPGRVSMLQQALGIKPESVVLGTVARLDPVKNQQMMLQSFAIVSRQFPHLLLLLVGDGPSRTALEHEVARLGIDTQVRFTGFQTHVADYLALMDIYLLSSHTEGTSMTLLEAMHLQLPCVATAVGGNPEVVANNESGLLSPDNDPAAFASNIQTLLENTSLKITMGQAGKRRFEALFSVGQMVASYSRIYVKAVNK